MKGIFLGTFWPMHIGHIRFIANALQEDESIDSIDVIPTFQNPNKIAHNNFDLRVDMAKEMIGNYFDHNVIVNDIEGKLKYKYTYSVLDYLHLQKNDFAILITYETFVELLDKKWKNYDHILATNKFHVFCTNDFMKDELEVKVNRLKNEINISVDYNVLYIDAEILLHSTNIRYMIFSGKTPIPYISKYSYDKLKEYFENNPNEKF